MNENKSGRHSFLSFGLRDLLWATAFGGAVMGWWIERLEKKRAIETAESLERIVITKQAMIDQQVPPTTTGGTSGQ